MYDKLGDMLNEALESGKIPQKEPDDTVVEYSQSERIETTAESGSFILNDEKKSGFGRLKHRIFKKKQQISTGEVIKMHKYTYNMQFPPEIQNALTTLDIAYPFKIKNITTAYHKKLKEVHPDTQNTIQTSKDVQNYRQFTIDEIKDAYKLLCNFFHVR